MSSSSREALESIMRAGLEAVHSGNAVSRWVRRLPNGSLRVGDRILPPRAGLWVAAMGKAAPHMAAAVEAVSGDHLRGGLVVSPEGHFQGISLSLESREAGHPFPDQRSERAARDLLKIVQGIPDEDILLVLLSGGASALTACPAVGLTLVQLEEATRMLLASGADIGEVNSVRKHCSSFSGGRLAVASATRKIEVLAISDVPGDRVDVIGSGPCSADETTFSDAREVLDRFGLTERIASPLRDYLEAGVQGKRPESHQADAPGLQGVHYRVIASNQDARSAACQMGQRLGLRTVDLGEIMQGEARVMGARLAALSQGVRWAKPILLVAGGETVVRVTGDGRGGRNQELALSAALEWDRMKRVRKAAILSVGTDGRDGQSEATGAFADEKTVRHGLELGLEASKALERNDSYGFFSRVGGSLPAGPTGTNVMDLALLWVDEK